MRKLGFFVLASGLFWAGVIGNDSLGTATTAQRNIDNLSRISLGMSKEEVFHIMRHPYRMESFQLNSDQYEVWFYVTSATLMRQKQLTHRNLTPLLFKNGYLDGKGYSEYDKALRQKEKEEQGEEKSDEDESDREDYELEKALQPPPKTTPPSKSPPPKQPLSMSKPTPPKPPPQEEPKEDAVPFDEQDEEMIDQEQEQNFDFW